MILKSRQNGNGVLEYFKSFMSYFISNNFIIANNEIIRHTLRLTKSHCSSYKTKLIPTSKTKFKD